MGSTASSSLGIFDEMVQSSLGIPENEEEPEAEANDQMDPEEHNQGKR